MNIHKRARLTFARRLEMVQQMTLQGLSAAQAAAVQGVRPPTASSAAVRRGSRTLKADNRTGWLAYAPTSFVKTAVPLVRRNLTVGVNVAF